jgi:hypothetical protein
MALRRCGAKLPIVSFLQLIQVFVAKTSERREPSRNFHYDTGAT